MNYKIQPSSKFKGDLKVIKKRSYNTNLLKEVINVLASGKQLDQKYLDHQLKGEYCGFRECHITPDWLLIYKIEKDILVLALTRTGTHSDLF